MRRTAIEAGFVGSSGNALSVSKTRSGEEEKRRGEARGVKALANVRRVPRNRLVVESIVVIAGCGAVYVCAPLSVGLAVQITLEIVLAEGWGYGFPDFQGKFSHSV